MPLLGAWLPAGCERTHARDLFTSRANQPARFLGGEKQLGIVAKGTVADLVLLDADPLNDIHNTTKISGVFLAGKEFDRAAPDQMFEKREAAAHSQVADEKKGIEDEIDLTLARNFWSLLQSGAFGLLPGSGIGSEFVALLRLFFVVD